MLAFESLSKASKNPNAPSETTDASIEDSEADHESNTIGVWCSAMQRSSKDCKFLSFLSTSSGPSVKSRSNGASELTIASTPAKQKREKQQPAKPDVRLDKLAPIRGERFDNELSAEEALEEPLDLRIETKRDASIYSDLSLNFKCTVRSHSWNLL